MKAPSGGGSTHRTIKRQQKKVEEQFDSFDQRITALEARLSKIEQILKVQEQQRDPLDLRFTI
jgi:flagellar capping protein FliD